MALLIADILKNINGGIWSVSFSNALYRLKVPKIEVRINQPAKEGSGKKCDTAATFLDVKEISTLIRRIRNIDKANPEKILESYKGGRDKNRLDENGQKKIIARIFRAKRDMNKNTVILSLELTDGEQLMVANKAGAKVPGIVKPKRGGTTYVRNSISLSKDEAYYIADMLDRELFAWRAILNGDFYRNPDKYNMGMPNNAPADFDQIPPEFNP